MLAESEARIGKERSMRQRRLRKYLETLRELSQRKRPLKRDALHQALGAAKQEAGRDARHVRVEVSLHGEGKGQTATVSYREVADQRPMTSATDRRWSGDRSKTRLTPLSVHEPTHDSEDRRELSRLCQFF